MNNIAIDGTKIGAGNPTYFIAELSGNHVQRFDIAKETLKAMREAGADAVKLQTYTADTITLNSDDEDFQINQGTIWDGRTLHDLYQEAFTPWDWQPKLQAYAKELGLTFFSSPFDVTAVDFLEKWNVPAYKIASFEITDIPLIEYIASKGKPVIFSTGVAQLDDIKLALKAIKSTGNDQVAILKCTSQYPTPWEEVNLRTIPDMIRQFKTVVGVSDHTNGIVVPIAAVAMGASIVEKHFILDRGLGGPDAAFSLEPSEFKQMVDNVRIAERALGQVTYDLGEKAAREREHTRSIYVSEPIKKGEQFTEQNIRSVRPGFGMHPKYYKSVLGRTANKDLKFAERMNLEFVSEKE